MTATPNPPTAATGSRTSPAINTMHQPITQMTPASRYWEKSKLKVHATRITVSSSRTSHRPRRSRKRETSGCRRPYRYALVPARKMKAGAQKWVIQRVKKMPGVGPPGGRPE